MAPFTAIYLSAGHLNEVCKALQSGPLSLKSGFEWHYFFVKIVAIGNIFPCHFLGLP